MDAENSILNMENMEELEMNYKTSSNLKWRFGDKYGHPLTTKELLERMLDGREDKEVAEEIGIHPCTLTRWKKDLKIPIHPMGGARHYGGRKKKQEMMGKVQVISVDFDGTLVNDRWPKIGAPDKEMIKAFIELKKKGFTIILNTCRQGDDLREAVDYLKRKGLTFHYINENASKGYRGLSECRKIFADVHYDDRSFNWDREEALIHIQSLIEKGAK